MANPEDLVAVVEQLVQRVASLTDKLGETNKQLQSLAEGSGSSRSAPTEPYAIPKGFFIESDVRLRRIVTTQHDVDVVRKRLDLHGSLRCKVITILDAPVLVLDHFGSRIQFPYPRGQIPLRGTAVPEFSKDQLGSLLEEELAQWPWQHAADYFLPRAQRKTRLLVDGSPSSHPLLKKQSHWFTQNSQGVIRRRGREELSSSVSSRGSLQPSPSRDFQYG